MIQKTDFWVLIGRFDEIFNNLKKRQEQKFTLRHRKPKVDS
jgi:hypothetical protein